MRKYIQLWRKAPLLLDLLAKIKCAIENLLFSNVDNGDVLMSPAPPKSTVAWIGP